MSDEMIIQKVNEYLDKKQIPYDKDSIDVSYKPQARDRNGKEMPLYFVAYNVGPFFSEYKLHFMVIDATTTELLYIMTPHGYLEIK